jgi:serine/threonine protein kinase
MRLRAFLIAKCRLENGDLSGWMGAHRACEPQRAQSNSGSPQRCRGRGECQPHFGEPQGLRFHPSERFRFPSFQRASSSRTGERGDSVATNFDRREQLGTARGGSHLSSRTDLDGAKKLVCGYTGHISSINKGVRDVPGLDAERMARFQREAKVLASLNHPNIASIYRLEDSGATHALVMELVER